MKDNSYVAEQEATILRNFEARQLYWNTVRFAVIRDFVSNFKKSLSVGCGGYEPVRTGVNHACDISDMSETYLRLVAWKGDFKVADCTALPYKEKEFDVVVCTEVIEHLPSLQAVQDTFKEIERIGQSWIITTPCNPLGKLNPEPTHKWAFSDEQLKYFDVSCKAKIYKDNLYYYVVKDDTASFAGIFDKYSKGEP